MAFVYKRACHQFSTQDYSQRASSLTLAARQTGFPALAVEVEFRSKPLWSARPVVWNPESAARRSRGSHQRQLSGSIRRETPAALSNVAGSAGLFRTQTQSIEAPTVSLLVAATALRLPRRAEITSGDLEHQLRPLRLPTVDHPEAQNVPKDPTTSK
jgi:hypothetical protein